MRGLTTGVALAAIIAPAGPARAADWGVTAEGLTEFPSHIGTGVRLETPVGLEIAGSIGWLPGGYAAAINGTLEAFDVLDADQADALTAALDDSLVLRTTLAWQPWREHGLWVEAGYALLALGGDATGVDVITIVTGVEPQGPVPGDAAGHYDLGVTAHRFHVGVGWRWALRGGWSVRAGLGGDFTFAAGTAIEPRFRPENPDVVRMFTRAAEAEFDELVTDFLHNPSIIVVLGYELF